VDQLKVRLRESWPTLFVDVTSATQTLAGSSVLDIDPDVVLPALQKLLSVDTYRPTDFLPPEQAFLLDRGYVVKNADGSVARADTLERDVGKWLFDCLFPDDHTRGLFYATRRSSNGGLEIQLQLDPDATVVGHLPWELLWTGPDFFAVGGQGTVSRRLVFDGRDANRAEIGYQELRVLVISPRPHDPALAELGSAEAGAIEGIEGLKVEHLDPPTMESLGQFVDANGGRNAPHIIHFDGHGRYGRACKNCKWVSPRRAPACDRCHTPLSGNPEGFLVWENDQRGPNFVSAENVAAQLGIAITDQDSALRLIVLSACQSTTALAAETEFSGVAQRLISTSAPAVVAMQYSVEVNAAISFSRRLYTDLLEERSLVDAVRRARTDLKVNGADQWYRPVLYLDLNSGEGRFFRHLTAPVSVPPKPDDARVMDDLSQVDRSFGILAYAVSAQPVLLDAEEPFRSAFNAAGQQLDRMADYKDIHDQLHALSLWYAVLLTELDRAGGPTTKALRLLENELATHIASLDEISGRAPTVTRTLGWVGDLKAARTTLNQIADDPTARISDYPLRKIDPILATVPAQINSLLDTAARGLPLDDLSQALATWQRALATGSVEQQAPATNGREALARVGDVLGKMIDEHSRCQDLQRELNLVHDALGKDAAEFAGQVWPDLRTRLEARWTDARLQSITQAIVDERARFDQLVSGGDFAGLSDQWDACASTMIEYFYGLDLEVQTLCHRMQGLRGALNMLGEALDQRVGAPA
jgi:hypothetical protein